MVRRWRSWYRWVTLAMVAHAFLVVAALLQRIRHPPPPELIPLTRDEVSHLFVGLAARPLGHLAHRLRWSLWRRRHQAHARTCHYRRLATWDPSRSRSTAGGPSREQRRHAQEVGDGKAARGGLCQPGPGPGPGPAQRRTGTTAAAWSRNWRRWKRQ